MEIIRKYRGNNQIKYVIPEKMYYNLIRTAFKNRKFARRSLLLRFCDKLYYREIGTIDALISVILVFSCVIIGVNFAVKINTATKFHWLAWLISASTIIVSISIAFLPIAVQELAEKIHYKADLVHQTELVNSIVDGTEIVEINKSEQFHLEIKDGDNPDRKDNASIGRYFESVTGDKDNYFVVKFDYRGNDLLLHTIDVK